MSSMVDTVKMTGGPTEGRATADSPDKGGNGNSSEVSATAGASQEK
jgi:hypothetical protein